MTTHVTGGSVIDSSHPLEVRLPDGAQAVTLGDATVAVSGPLTDAQLRATHIHADVQLIDDAGAAYGVKQVDGKPRVSSMDYLYDIAEGNVAGHSAWNKLSYNGNVGTTEIDIWALGGTYSWPATAQQMQVVSSSAKDVGARAITAFADAGGGNTTVTCGTHGLANSDIVTISGTTNYNGTYTIANVNTNTFTIVKAYAGNDATSALAGPGIHQVTIFYLDASFVEHTETVTLNGLNAVNTVATDIFRVNWFRAASIGATGAAVGNVTLKNTGATVTYSQVSAGYNRARNSTYTVADGKTLYVTSFSMGVYGATKGVRLTCRSDYDSVAGANKDYFIPFAEIAMTNGAFHRPFEIPTKMPQHTRLKVSGVADAAGAVVTVSLRGWIETEADEAPAGVMMSLAMVEPAVHPAPMGAPTLWERLRGGRA